MTNTLRRMPIVALLLAAALVGAGPGVTQAGATTDREERLLALLNQERVARGIPALRLNQSLSGIARNHSRQMAGNGRLLYDSCLSCSLGSWSWEVAGENVGAAGTLTRVNALFMKSPSHRSNILRSRFKRVGIGVSRRGNLIWVTQIFLG